MEAKKLIVGHGVVLARVGGFLSELPTEGVGKLQDHVEGLFSNAFEMLGTKMTGAREPKVLYEHFDVDEMMVICAPHIESISVFCLQKFNTPKEKHSSPSDL